MPRSYMVIVHPAGWVDFERQPAYWSEVPAASACAATGDSVEEVVSRTRDELRRWLEYVGGSPAPRDLSLDVLVAA